MERSLVERVRELAQEARQAVDDIEVRRLGLFDEREQEVARVRMQYAERLAAVEEEKAAAVRLARTLDPKFKIDKKPRPGRRRQWRPRPANFAHVLRALHDHDGAATVSDLGAAVPMSDATVKVVIDHARRDGWVRLAGTEKRRSMDAKVYRLTPEGEEQLQVLTMNGALTVGSNA